MAFELIEGRLRSDRELVRLTNNLFFVSRPYKESHADFSIDRENKLFLIEFTNNGIRKCTKQQNGKKISICCKKAATLIREMYNFTGVAVLDAKLEGDNKIIIKGVLEEKE